MAEQILRGPGEGRTYGVVGHRYRVLVTGKESDGAYALIEALVPPGDGPPPHEHAHEDEAYYVVDGRLQFNVGGQEITGTAGTFVNVPRGVVHAFHNPGPVSARLLVQCHPAGLEKFFQEVGVPMDAPDSDPPPSTVEHMEKVLVTAPKYGMKIHLPTSA